MNISNVHFNKGELLETNQLNLIRNVKLLMKIYPIIRWRLNDKISILRESNFKTFGSVDTNMIEVLTDLDNHKDFLRLESWLNSFEESEKLLATINNAFDSVKQYPNRGEYYYSIIHMNYIDEKHITENRILEILHVCRTSYYRDKKKAILLLGIILWERLYQNSVVL